MKAYIKTTYGGPEVLQLSIIEKPAIQEGHLLVKVHANSVNPADWHIIRGKPLIARFSFGLFKPKERIPGADFSGIVEEAGKGVTHFKVGDRVFGETLMGGAFAEYILVPAKVCALIPEGTDFPEMACLPIAGLTALQAVITHGKLKEGESVLINGASGGVGHLAVQVSKIIGARITAVCSAKNRDFVKALGAEEVIAYDLEDLRRHRGKYNLVIDAVGNITHADYKRMGHRGVAVGFTRLGHMMRLFFNKTFSKFPLAQFSAVANSKDLETLASLVKNGKLRVHIEKTYSYSNIPEAIKHIETMHTRGKLAMVWD